VSSSDENVHHGTKEPSGDELDVRLPCCIAAGFSSPAENTTNTRSIRSYYKNIKNEHSDYVAGSDEISSSGQISNFKTFVSRKRFELMQRDVP
jgi:hypothetical protein